MKKYLYLALGLALLVGLMMPSVVMAEDEQTIYLENPGSDYNTGGEWNFVINQIDSGANAPQSILLHWSDGGESIVPLNKFTGRVAYYCVDGRKHPGAYPTCGETRIHERWKGRFNRCHKPTAPVPELPVIGLMGLGLASLGAFIFIKRKTLLAKLG